MKKLFLLLFLLVALTACSQENRTSCSKDSDCTLYYSSCSCEVTNINVAPMKIKDGRTCVFNQCAGVPVCNNGICQRSDLANATLSVERCNGININFINKCLFIVAYSEKNGYVCMIINSSSYKDDCWRIVGELTNDTKICDQLISPDQNGRILSMHQDRYVGCYCRIANMTKDPLVCKNIDVVFTSKCLANAMEVPDETICQKLGNNSNECYIYVAEQKNDIKICEFIAYEIEKNRCKSIITTKIGNPEGCNNLDAYKESCYLGIASSTNNVSLCKFTGIFQNQCYSSIGTSTLNISICEMATDEDGYRGTCITNIARNTNNINVCNRIISPGLRLNCEQSIQ